MEKVPQKLQIVWGFCGNYFVWCVLAVSWTLPRTFNKKSANKKKMPLMCPVPFQWLRPRPMHHPHSSLILNPNPKNSNSNSSSWSGITATTSKCTLLSIMLVFLLLLLFVFIVMGHVMAMSCGPLPSPLSWHGVASLLASTVLRAYKIFCNFVTSQLWRRHLKLHLTKKQEQK